MGTLRNRISYPGQTDKQYNEQCEGEDRTVLPSMFILILIIFLLCWLTM